MSFLEKTSMFRIKVCQAVEYNVTGKDLKTHHRLHHCPQSSHLNCDFQVSPHRLHISVQHRSCSLHE